MAIYNPGQESPPNAWKIALIYGDLFSYKSSMSLTTTNPILIDFGQGSHRAHNHKEKPRFILEKGWNEIEAYARDGELEKYQTIVIDELKSLVDKWLIPAILEDSPGLRDVNGSLTIGGYGVLFNRLEEFMKMIQHKNIVVIAHGDFDGDEIKRAVPLMSGKTAQFFGGLCDQMGYVHKVDDKVVIDFGNSGRWVSKDKAGIGRVEVPHYNDPAWPTFFQAAVIDKLGWGTEIKQEKIDMVDESVLLDEYKIDLEAAKTADDLNQLSKKIATGPPLSKPIKILLLSLVKEKSENLGLKFNKSKKAYETPVMGKEIPLIPTISE